MEKTILLFLCGFTQVCAINYRLKRKHNPGQRYLGQEFVVTVANKKMGDADYEDQRKYEQLQHDDYMNNTDKYEKWPDMDYQPMKELCEVGIQQIFRKSRKLELVPEIFPEPIPLIYRIIKDENNKPMKPIMVSVLQCYFPMSNQRQYYLFIKGLRSHCLFLVKPLVRSWKHPGGCKNMAIVNEFCDESYNEGPRGKHSQAAARGQSMSKDAIRMRLKSQTDEANSQLRVLYEQSHFDYYNLKPDDCRTWPELNDVNTGIFCKTFAQKILTPFVIQNEVLAEVKKSEKLIYEKISAEPNKNLEPLLVAMLQCRIPEARRIKRGLFRFIRAPNSHCVFLVKPTAWNFPMELVIFNKYCSDLDLEREILPPYKT